MNRNDDFIGQLEDYLQAFDGSTPLPDRVRDAIRAELPSARQVRPRPGYLRVNTMLSSAPVGVRWGFAAALVVAAVLGAAFLNSNRSGGAIGGPSTPTPAPTNQPTPLPSASATTPPLTLGEAPYVACATTDTGQSCLSAGTYQLSGGSGVWPVMVTLDVPVGWFEWEPGTGADAVLVNDGPEGIGVSGWGVLFATVGDVAHDPCDATKGVIPAATIDTPQKLVAAMAAWPGFTATAPQPVTVDGHAGLKVELTSTAPSGCSATGWLWKTASGVAVDTYPMIGTAAARAPGTFEIVDTGHGLLVIRTTDFPQTSPNEVAAGVASSATRHAADLTELRAMLDSIRLTVSSSP